MSRETKISIRGIMRRIGRIYGDSDLFSLLMQYAESARLAVRGRIKYQNFFSAVKNAVIPEKLTDPGLISAAVSPDGRSFSYRELSLFNAYAAIIAVSELSIIGISLFPGKYLYTNKIAKQKIQKYDWWKGCLTILICSIVVRCLFRKISPLISDDHKLIYSIIIIMIVGIIFQIVNWMMVFRFVAEKTNGKS